MLNQVRTIWLRLLQRVSVGCDEDFMEAGGTQVQMIRMHVELNRLFPRRDHHGEPLRSVHHSPDPSTPDSVPEAERASPDPPRRLSVSWVTPSGFVVLAQRTLGGAQCRHRHGCTRSGL